jgi:hypothetical protein
VSEWVSGTCERVQREARVSLQRLVREELPQRLRLSSFSLARLLSRLLLLLGAVGGSGSGAAHGSTLL